MNKLEPKAKQSKCKQTKLNQTKNLSQLFKGECHEIFFLHFFHDLNPSRPLINRLKYFPIRFQFCQDIQVLKKLSRMHPTLESSSAMCITPRSQTPGGHPPAESSSAVCIPPRSHTLRCASHRGIVLCGVHPTAESNCTCGVKIENFVSLWCF